MKTLLLITFAASLTACNLSDKPGAAVAGAQPIEQAVAAMKDTARYTTIEWMDSVKQDLGTVQEGQIVEISWKFRNSGKYPLVVENVQPGCGCTLADKPKEPVAPGGEGVIKAKFDTKGRPGHADKTMSMTANISNHNNGANTMLHFTADVKD